MRIRWFGESWGEDGRAPVCEEEFRIETPVGVACSGDCGELIAAGDRGIACAAWRGAEETPGPGGPVFSLIDGKQTVRFCVAFHIDCWIGMILPEARHAIERRP